ncbi:MAG: hypothetical protein GSR72_04160, partial [Desulfurococcales archaeon]|nr:hypothetical protein [Desulfurococcales archaeon]
SVQPGALALDSILFGEEEVVLMTSSASTSLLFISEDGSIKKVTVINSSVKAGAMSVASPDLLLVSILCKNESIRVYGIYPNYKYKLLYNISINPLFYSMEDVSISPTGYIAAGGTTVSTKLSLQNYLVFLHGDAVVWRKEWGGPSKDIVIDVENTDDLVCGLSIPNTLKCFDTMGNVVMERMLGDTITTFKIYDNNIIINYIQFNKSYIADLNRDGTMKWNIDITPYIITDININYYNNIIAASGFIKTNGRYYPGLVFIDKEGKLIANSKFNYSLKQPMIVLVNSYNDKFAITYINGTMLHLDIVKLGMANQTTTTNIQDGSTTSSKSTENINKLLLIHYLLVSAIIVIIGIGIYIYLFKIKINK